MKTLLILRHAKSDWGDENLSDHDRPLSERGKHDAPRVGAYLKKHDLHPTAVFSSTAKRAKKTAEKVLKSSGDDAEMHVFSSLYLAGPEAYVRVLVENGGEHPCLMVVGHNPGLEQLVARLTGETVHLPTAALVEVRFDLDEWNELDASTRGELIRYWRPEGDES